MAAKVALTMKQSAEFHCSFLRQARRHAGLHAWRVIIQRIPDLEYRRQIRRADSNSLPLQ